MKSVPLEATHEGHFTLGKWSLNAFNLSNGMRVFDQRSLVEILNVTPDQRSTAGLKKIADHPLMREHALSVNAFFFSKCVKFRTLDGRLLEGYAAEELIEFCKFLLKAREMGAIRSLEYSRQARAAEALIVSLANVGLLALIDEATGYQRVRSADALHAALDKYLKKELAAWTKRFPDEFYQQLYRLKEWKWEGMSVNRPQIVGTYTKNIVYERLAPGILAELERRNPDRLHRHHQWLTDDVGHPALAQHLYAVIAIMKLSKTWSRFREYLQQAFPLRGDQLPLDLEDI